jgi:hypothetical protein
LSIKEKVKRTSDSRCGVIVAGKKKSGEETEKEQMNGTLIWMS